MSEELIRLNDALEAITDHLCEDEIRHNIEPRRRVNRFFATVMLENVPRIERKDEPQTCTAVEPKRGRWRLTRIVKTNSIPEHWLRCSACGNYRVIKIGEAFPDWCENCGADMRMENDHE